MATEVATMASLYKRAGKYWMLQFATPDKSVKRIHLGEIPDRTAQRLRDKVEMLVQAAYFGMPPDESLNRWVVSIADTPLATKLQAAGLLKQSLPRKLESFLDEYIRMRTDVKENTRKHMVSSKNRILGFFSPEIGLSEVNRGGAEAFKIHLLGKFSSATAGRTLKAAIQFFEYAKDCKLILENPFKRLKIPKQTNESNRYFVDRETSQKILDAQTSIHKKLVFALARYGGLRIPSEVINLKWEDVDWDKKRILVYSPKTEHHEGKEKRFIPLFPELVSILREAQDLNQGVSRFVCGKVRSGTLNLRTGLLKTLKSLGIKPWPKLFVNLRSSRETELVERFPLHVVTEWIGHTPEIAAKHYLQVLEQHWACAAEESTSGFFAPRKLKE